MAKYCISCVAAFLLAIAAMPERAHSQLLRWSTDRITYAYKCNPDTVVTFWLINNNGATPIVVSHIYGSFDNWQIVEFPTLPIEIPGHDSIKFVLKPKHAFYPGTFSTDLYPDVYAPTILPLTLKRHGPVLTTSPLTIEIDSIIAGDTVAREITLTNEGDIDFVYRSLVLSGAIPNVRLTDFHPGSIIKPGESRTITLEFWSYGRQYVFGTVDLIDECNTRSIQITGSFVPTGPQWLSAAITDTVKGCDTGSVHILTVTSDITHRETVDSVRLGSDMMGWSFVDEPGAFEIESGREFLVQLRREQFAGPRAHIILYPHNRPPDSAWIDLAFSSPWIVFDTPDDTVFYDLDFDERKTVSVRVRNIGNTQTSVHRLDIETTDSWVPLQIPDDGRIEPKRSIALDFLFEGGSSTGEYPITFTVLDRECQQIIRQTLIARVGMTSGIDKQEIEDAVRVHPSIANDRITIDATGAFRYGILDLLGREVMRGEGFALHAVDVSLLPRGSYFLRVVQHGAVSTRKILLVE